MATQVVLERDGHDQAWGFRLQGGTDVGLPLSIQRVLVGTPSEAVLKRGDVITKVGPVSTTGLTHQQAADLISAAGNKIEITVKRAVSGAPKMPSSAQPSVSSLQASAAHRQQQLQQEQQQQQSQSGAASSDQKSTWSPAAIPASGPIAGPVPVKLPPSASLPQTLSPQPAKYNSAAGLYANQSSGYLKKPAGTGMINPVNRPTNKLPFFALAKKYDPEQSATWQAIHEQENCQLVTEHGPTESKVYSI